MAVTGWIYPTTVVSSTASSGAGTAWTNPGNAVSPNDVRTGVFLALAGQKSQHLLATGFNFGDLTGATGISVEVRIELTGATIEFFRISLSLGGTIQATNKAGDAGTVPASEATPVVVGGDGTYWSATLTPAALSSFGFAVQMISATGSGLASVDALSAQVTYTPASSATLEVKQGGTPVTTLDFGTTKAGTPVQQTVQLHAVDGDVTISDITVPAGYSIISEPSFIAEGDSEDLVLQLNATTGGTKSGAVQITSDAAPASFTVTGSVTSTVFVYVAHDTNPWQTGYHFGGSDFGGKLAAPSTVATGKGQRVRFSPDGRFVGMVHTTSPFVTIHHFDYSTGAIGSKVSDPPTAIPNTGRGIAWNPDGTLVAIAHNNSPFVSVYNWSSSGFGSKLTNPSVLAAGNGFDVVFSPDGRHIAIAHATTPFVAAWSIAGNVFGSKVPDPGTPPAGTGNGVCFSRDGSMLFVAHTTTPFITGYPWSNGFGSKFTNPGTLPAGNGTDAAVSPDGAYLAVAHVTSPRVTVYPISGSGFGTKLPNPGTLPTGNGRGVAWSPDGTRMVVAHDTTPYVTCYEFSAGFGSKLNDPAAISGIDAMGVCFSPRFEFKPWFVRTPQALGVA